MKYKLYLTIVPTMIDLNDYPNYHRTNRCAAAISCYSVESFTYEEVLKELEFFASRSIILQFELKATGVTLTPDAHIV